MTPCVKPEQLGEGYCLSPECSDDLSGFVAEIIVSFGSEGRSIPRWTYFCVNEQR